MPVIPNLHQPTSLPLFLDCTAREPKTSAEYNERDSASEKHATKRRKYCAGTVLLGGGISYVAGGTM